MPPVFGTNYNFEESTEDYGEFKSEDENSDVTLTQMTFWYMMVLVVMLLSWLIIFFCLRIITLGQKTRSQQQRRVFVGQRARPSLQEPTIYVSPANLPPPPKYEALAPPSYEEVMSVTYPNYPQTQPIVYPLTHAVAQTSNNNNNINNNTNSNSASRIDPSPSTVVTVTADDSRTSVTVATT